MTRINVVPVKELSDKHLLAEYRELPRVFALARQWYVKASLASSDLPYDEIPSTYRLGKGHVTFFYDRLLWCFNRQFDLYQECLDRGFDVKLDPRKGREDFLSAPLPLFNDYKPTAQAVRINRARIKERTR